MSWIYVDPDEVPELPQQEVVDLLHALAARSAATAADLRRMAPAADDDGHEQAEVWARRRGIVLMQRTYTSTEARRLGPGFAFEMPGMDLPDAKEQRPAGI